MEAQPAPFAKETQPKPETLLSEATTGAQALLLLGLEPPQPGRPAITLQKEQLLKSATKGIPEEHKKRLTNASRNERDEFWKDTPEAERMEKWRKGMNGFLSQYTKDQTKTAEQAFLKHIFKSDTLDTITADALYSTFMQGEGKGDVEYFARRIAETNTPQEIEQNQKLIASLGRIYGGNSARIAELLSYGIANTRHNLDKFHSSAEENITNRKYPTGTWVWGELKRNAARWDEKQQAKQGQPMQTTQAVDQTPQAPKPEQPQQPEEPAAAKEYHSLVADAGEFSEKDLNKGVPNQDARFVDAKHGAFGVFDGLGSYKNSKEVAEKAAADIGRALREQIDPHLPLDQTEKQVRSALIGVSEELNMLEDARYAQVITDIKQNAAGALSDDDFDEKYEGQNRKRSISKWIHRHFNPTKPDEINEYLKAWMDEQVQGATTASVVKLWQGPQGERKAIIANAGDSRVYHYSARDGKLRIVTIDDTPLHDAVGEAKAREIQDAEAGGRRMQDILGAETIVLKQSNPQQRAVWQSHGEGFQKNYPWDTKGEAVVPLREINNSSMTKLVPMGDLTPNTQTINVEPQDKLIIVSDGVHDYSLSPEMEEVLTNPDNREAAKAAEALVKFAKRREAIPGIKAGQLQDDTTAVVVEIK